MNRMMMAAMLILANATIPAMSFASPTTHYSTAYTRMGTLRANPEAKAAIAKQFPSLFESKAVNSGMADRMTLRSLKRFKPKIFTDAGLAALDVELAKLPAR